MKTTWLISLMFFLLISRIGIISQFENRSSNHITKGEFQQILKGIAYYPLASTFNFLIVAFVWMFGAPYKIGNYDSFQYAVMTEQLILAVMLVALLFDLLIICSHFKRSSEKIMAGIVLAICDLLIFALYLALFSKDFLAILNEGLFTATW